MSLGGDGEVMPFAGGRQGQQRLERLQNIFLQVNHIRPINHQVTS
jgi:hypothetical protein